MVVSFHDVRKREYADLIQSCGGFTGAPASSRGLIKDESKLSSQLANHVEGGVRRLNIGHARPSRNEAKICSAKGGGYGHVVCARRVDNREGASLVGEPPYRSLKRVFVFDPFHPGFGEGSPPTPVRDGALTVGVEQRHPFAQLHGGHR